MHHDTVIIKTASAALATVAVAVGVSPAAATADQRPPVQPAPREPKPARPWSGPTSCDALLQKVADSVRVIYKGRAECPGSGAGALVLQASLDGTNWKNVDSVHAAPESFVKIDHTCWPGGWFYQGYLIADDHSYKGPVTPMNAYYCAATSMSAR